MIRVFKHFRFVLFIAFISLNGCGLSESTGPYPPAPQLKLVATYNLDVPEPSGLALHPDGQSLWTVSDQTNQVYRINLTGGIIQTLSYTGVDLEGVAYDSFANCIWVAEERTRELVRLDLTGNEVERHKILGGQDNSGLEGICIDKVHHFFVLKEKNPGLFIELNPDFSVKKQVTLQFAGDYSGMWADTVSSRFWIVSDESQSIFLWDESKGVIKQFSLPVKKAEGVAYDMNKCLFYVVSDAESKLFVFTET